MIELFDNYIVNVDSYNYSLGIKKTSKDKEGVEHEYIDYISYHKSLVDLLVALTERIIKGELKGSVRSLQESTDTIVKHYKHMEEYIKENLGNFRV